MLNKIKWAREVYENERKGNLTRKWLENAYKPTVTPHRQLYVSLHAQDEKNRG